jgi:hypothetical protein
LAIWTQMPASEVEARAWIAEPVSGAPIANVSVFRSRPAEWLSVQFLGTPDLAIAASPKTASREKVAGKK